MIRGQLLICLINGMLTYIGLLIFGVKYALILAGIAATMSLIPIFGSILSSVPIVAVALVSSGSFDIDAAASRCCVDHRHPLVEANFLNPKIIGNAAKIHPVLVVFALIAGEHSYGLVGRAVRGAGRVDHPDDLRLLPPPRARRAGDDQPAVITRGVRSASQSEASWGARSGPAINAERSGTSRQPGRAPPSRVASMTNARSDS